MIDFNSQPLRNVGLTYLLASRLFVNSIFFGSHSSLPSLARIAIALPAFIEAVPVFYLTMPILYPLCAALKIDFADLARSVTAGGALELLRRAYEALPGISELELVEAQDNIVYTVVARHSDPKVARDVALSVVAAAGCELVRTGPARSVCIDMTSSDWLPEREAAAFIDGHALRGSDEHAGRGSHSRDGAEGVDGAERRVLHLGHAARRPRRAGDAPAGGDEPGRPRAVHAADDGDAGRPLLHDFRGRRPALEIRRDRRRRVSGH